MKPIKAKLTVWLSQTHQRVENVTIHQFVQGFSAHTPAHAVVCRDSDEQFAVVDVRDLNRRGTARPA